MGVSRAARTRGRCSLMVTSAARRISESAYPERMPAYDVIFAFLNEDERRPAVPHWALPVVLEEEELEEK